MAKAKIKELIHYYDGWGPDLYDDGIITYKAPRKSDFSRAFNKLERTLGIKTKRVNNFNKADIVCQYKSTGNWAGVHMVNINDKNGKKYSKIEVTPNQWWTQSTVVHEIGHALGLGHPDDMSRTDTIMSYGAPGDLPWFTKLDRKVLDYLY